MDKNKTLIVIINDYPYNNGETFFENEVEFLSKTFKSIYVFSVVGNKQEKQTRAYPSNVRCFPLSCNHNKIKYCLKGLFSNHNGFTTINKNIFKFVLNNYIYGRNLEIYKKIKKHVVSNSIDLSNAVVYSYWLTLGISAIKIQEYIEHKYKYKPLTVSRCHRYDLYKNTNKFNYQPLQEQVVSKLDYVCPCSNFGRTYLINEYPNAENKIVVAKLGTKFHTVTSTKNNCYKKIFLTCSGLRPVKRLDLFAEGFVLATKINKDIYWACIGDGEEKEKIVDIINRNNISDRVIFLGNLKNNDVYKYYENNYIYCFVNVSSSEGIPVAIMEAISYGTPVIATNVGGNSEIVDNTNGLLLDKNITKENICESILKLCDIKEDVYINLRNNSRSKWEGSYNADLNYNNWVKFLINSKEEDI